MRPESTVNCASRFPAKRGGCCLPQKAVWFTKLSELLFLCIYFLSVVHVMADESGISAGTPRLAAGSNSPVQAVWTNNDSVSFVITPNVSLSGQYSQGQVIVASGGYYTVHIGTSVTLRGLDSYNEYQVFTYANLNGVEKLVDIRYKNQALSR